MGVSLKKGGNVSLSKEFPDLLNVGIGLGWKPRETKGINFDLDASAFLIADSGKVKKDSDFIFYDNLISDCKSVKHSGDNRTGDGDGDDEFISVSLVDVPSSVNKVVFTVTIYDYEKYKLNFGQVDDAYIRVVDLNSPIINSDGDNDFKEIARYDLSEDASTVTAMIFGELYRYNGEWKFKAVGQGFEFGLGELATNFGVNVEG